MKKFLKQAILTASIAVSIIMSSEAFTRAEDLIVRDSSGNLRLYPFQNNTFYNNGGGTIVGNGFNFTDYFPGDW